MEFIKKLQSLKEKFDQITEQLSEPGIVSNQERYVKLNRERSGLLEIVETYNEYNTLIKNISGNKEIVSTSDEADLVDMAEMELEELKEKKAELEEKIKILLIPKDPDDDKSVIVEIRAGTGGDEAGLFAADLFRMYSRFAEVKGW